MALEGIGCRKIATRRNEEKVPPPATYAGLTVANAGPYTGLWRSEPINRWSIRKFSVKFGYLSRCVGEQKAAVRSQLSYASYSARLFSAD